MVRVQNQAQSQLPFAPPVQMTTTTDPRPSASPIPPPHGQGPQVPEKYDKNELDTSQKFKSPKLRLKIQDLSVNGAKSFLSAVNASTLLDDAATGVVKLLYPNNTKPPPTRSVTLVLRSMGGVAYTTGTDLDNDHKEIHLSTDYIGGVTSQRLKNEILGVIRHEMVHCYQFTGFGTAPGGLTEGIADWVRLKSGFVPPHWSKSATGDWDAGYQHTAYFLEYLEGAFGKDIVPTINEKLRSTRYQEDSFWQACCGCSVKKLWKEYGESLQKKKPSSEND